MLHVSNKCPAVTMLSNIVSASMRRTGAAVKAASAATRRVSSELGHLGPLIGVAQHDHFDALRKS